MTEAIKYFTDTHIAKAVATQLRLRGIEVVRCEDVQLSESDDLELLEYAAAHSFTLVTHDLGFWGHHGFWLGQGLHHAGIVLIHRQHQGDVGKIVRELHDLFLMVAEGVGTLHKDVYNKVYEVK